MTNTLTLFCLVDGESTVFSVKNIPLSDTIDDLKDLIKVKLSPRFDDISVVDLTLWHVAIPIADIRKHGTVTLDSQKTKNILQPEQQIADVFPPSPDRKSVYVIVERPTS
ncbi:hypothetical protein EDD11_010163, partial [Mortierella claussenii]